MRGVYGVVNEGDVFEVSLWGTVGFGQHPECDVSAGGEGERGVWRGHAWERVAHGGWVWNTCTRRQRPVIL